MALACARGASRLAAGDGSRALDEYRQALQQVVAVADAFVGTGDALMLLGHPADAIGAFQAAVLLRPNEPAPALRLGRALHEAGQPDAAEKVLRRAAERFDHVELWWTLYDVMGADGELTKQQVVLQRLMELEPRSALACGLYGALLAEQGVHTLAERFLLRARERAPEALILNAALLQLYARAGRAVDVGLEVGTIQIRLADSSLAPVDLQFIAQTLAAIGRRAAAIQVLRLARLGGASTSANVAELSAVAEPPRPLVYLHAWAQRRRAAGSSGAGNRPNIEGRSIGRDAQSSDDAVSDREQVSREDGFDETNE